MWQLFTSTIRRPIRFFCFTSENIVLSWTRTNKPNVQFRIHVWHLKSGNMRQQWGDVEREEDLYRCCSFRRCKWSIKMLDVNGFASRRKSDTKLRSSWTPDWDIDSKREWEWVRRGCIESNFGWHEVCHRRKWCAPWQRRQAMKM